MRDSRGRYTVSADDDAIVRFVGAIGTDEATLEAGIFGHLRGCSAAAPGLQLILDVAAAIAA
ncbi:MAG TPA: hypothetical protein DIU15_18230, partial [Deltaproteobacteria bacterium]|nr:hypothetical protein [Deltaproteobacteria bacterium]